MRGHSTWRPRLWTCHQNRGKAICISIAPAANLQALTSHTRTDLEGLWLNISASPKHTALYSVKILSELLLRKCVELEHRKNVMWLQFGGKWKKTHLALMRYWARLMLAGVPVMVIWRSDDPSMALAILIWAPDIWRISLILVPWRPIMQPISWEESGKVLKGRSQRKHSLCYRKYGSFCNICNWKTLFSTLILLKGTVGIATCMV